MINEDMWFKNGISVEVNATIRTNKTKAPIFNHTIIEELYKNNIRIPESTINEILSLPRKSLIQDLELVLTDCIERFDYFAKKYKNNYDDSEYSFVIHSAYLLAEIGSAESLNKIFDVLSQSEDCVELYFGDFITEGVWEIVYKLGLKKLDSLTEFMFQPGVSIFSRIAVADAVKEIAFIIPERKEEVLNWFDDILTKYLAIDSKANIVDAELVALIVGDVLDLGGVSLLPKIKKLWDKGYIFKDVCGDYEEIEKIMHAPRSRLVREVISINDRYKHVLETWAGYQENELEEEYYDEGPSDVPWGGSLMNYSYQEGQPIVKGKKIGRNEPCPCGSGKKYKKCCL